MSREIIYSALYDLVKASADYKTFGRKLKDWASVSPSQCPAIFQIQAGEDYNQKARGLDPLKSYYVDLYIYATDAANTNVPSTQLNNLLDSLEYALRPDVVSGFQTLGGVVSHAWIKGRIEIYEGVADSLTVAVVPIEILANY